MKVIRVHETGGPEMMRLDEVETPEPAEGEALVTVHAAGVNFIDTYQREGRYKAPLPLALGKEGSGVVKKVGPGVSEIRPGERVAWSAVQGSYATEVIADVKELVPIPDSVDFRQAAAAMLQGMTAHYLAETTYPIRKGETALVHAAAGGVGLLLTQLAHHKGVRVIGTVSTEEKARMAKEAGADEVILYSETDFETEVRRLTGGRGVDVVYDSVGKTTFHKSLACLRPRGMMVLFGGSSGAVEPFDPMELNNRGSIYLTRPTLFHHIADRSSLLQRAGDVLRWISAGDLKLHIDRVFPLSGAAEAHRALEGRKTTGKVLLEPERP